MVVGEAVFLGIADADTGAVRFWRGDGVSVAPATPPIMGLAYKQIIAANGFLFYEVDAVDRTELWRTNGTEAGTQLLTTTQRGACNSWYRRSLAATDGLVLFDWYEAATGCQLWRSDGSTTGTFRLTGDGPSVCHGIPDVVAAGKRAFFSDVNGTLCVTDG